MKAIIDYSLYERVMDWSFWMVGGVFLLFLGLPFLVYGAILLIAICIPVAAFMVFSEALLWVFTAGKHGMGGGSEAVSGLFMAVLAVAMVSIGLVL